MAGRGGEPGEQAPAWGVASRKISLDGVVRAPAQLAQELAIVLETEAQHLGDRMLLPEYRQSPRSSENLGMISAQLVIFLFQPRIERCSLRLLRR